MNNVLLLFDRGPDGGKTRMVTAVAGGIPDERWISPERNGHSQGANVNHTYLRRAQPEAPGVWVYDYDRAYPSNGAQR